MITAIPVTLRGSTRPRSAPTAPPLPQAGFGAGQGSLNDVDITFKANEHWMNYMGNASTPLDGTPVVTIRNAGDAGQNGLPIVSSTNPETGRIEFLEAVTGANAVYDPVESNDPDDLVTATTTIEVSFKYHVADMIGADQRSGSTAPSDENRVRVTSSSDGIGEWVKVTEVADIGSRVPDPTSNIYHGSIYLEPDSKIASANLEQIGVRDGDTLTVTLYEDDHVTVVDDDTATIDGEKPAILSISPGDGTITDRSSPVVTITVTDGGSGIDTSFPRDHVDISIVEGDTICRVYDTQLTATRLSSSELDILFRNTGSWIIGGSGITCDQGSDPDPDDPDVMVPRSTLANYKANSESINPGDNNNGVQFTVKVVARDVAGNESTEVAKLTIDTKAPALADGSTTGTNWDAKKKEEVEDRAAIKVVFNEALDASTVDVSDFVVENPDVSIESLQVAGADAADADSKNEVVYLKLSDDLASDARPRVELDGSIMDKAGNELKSAAIPRVEDGIVPGVTVDAFSRQLLPDKGESSVTFSADENLAAETAAVDFDECTCLAITGGSGVETTRGAVNLPTPSTATYTFKAGSTTGIYGSWCRAATSVPR